MLEFTIGKQAILLRFQYRYYNAKASLSYLFIQRAKKLKVTRKALGSEILNSMKEVASTRGTKLTGPLQPDTALLDTGLDSLSFAMLVASLERKLGYDPFVLSEKSFYPTTITQLCDYYHDNQPAQ